MRKNQYPLPERTVLYSHRKHIEPIPEVGKRYHCFDDGKVTPSRHFIVEVTEVLGHQQFKKKYPEEFKQYREAVKDCYWLYSTHSDKFIIVEHGEENERGVYVRTKQGEWFGIGNIFNAGRIDVTGRLWNKLLENFDLFDYTDEEKERIIKEGSI